MYAITLYTQRYSAAYIVALKYDVQSKNRAEHVLEIIRENECELSKERDRPMQEGNPYIEVGLLRVTHNILDPDRPRGTEHSRRNIGRSRWSP